MTLMDGRPAGERLSETPRQRARQAPRAVLQITPCRASAG